MKKAYTEASDF